VSIIDVSDITKPHTLSAVTNTIRLARNRPHLLKVPFPINGRSIAVSTEEERGHRGPDAGKRTRRSHLGRDRSDETKAAMHLSCAAFSLAL